jgi:hypothetical protein
LTWDITGLPDGLEANLNTGEISGVINPGAETQSPYVVTASVTDAAMNVATITFNWAVAAATVIPVTGTGDTGDGTLRAAITQANTVNGQVVIDMQGVSGTISLESALPSLARNITFMGPGSGNLYISRDTLQGNFRIFYMPLSTRIWVVEDVTLSWGNAGNGIPGGAIYNLGNLNLLGCSLQHNSAGSGGAIYNAGTVTVSNCAFFYNSAGLGGAIYNSSVAGRGTLILTTGCWLQANSASDFGGAIYNDQSTVVRIRDSVEILGNSAVLGGGIYNRGNLRMIGGSLTFDQATDNGRGYFGRGGTASFQGVDLDNNSAGNQGGGFYLDSGILGLNTCSIGTNGANSAGKARPGGYVKNGSTYNPPVNCRINDRVDMGA